MATEKQIRSRQLYEHLKSKKGINQSELASLMNRTQAYISKIISGATDKYGRPIEFSDDVIYRLQSAIGLNPKWYETGEGEMFQSMPEKNMNNSYLDIHRNRVIVVSEPAFASYTEHKGDPQYIRSLPTEELPLDLYAKGSTIIKILVNGDSMAPNFSHGEYVYCSRFEYCDLLDFQMRLRNGFVYLVIVKGRDPMLKRILYKPGEPFIRCHSDNKDQERYPPFQISLSELEELWYIERKYGGQFPPPDFLTDPQWATLPLRMQKVEEEIALMRRNNGRV